MKLVITPKPEKHEGLISYLVRLTEANAYDTPSWILSLSNIDYMELQWTFSFLFDSSKGLEKLAQLTDNTLANLRAISYIPPDSSQGEMNEHEFNFYGTFLNRSIIRPHCPKICPKCLSESGYCYRVWDCSLVTACPLHECVLLDTCPRCQQRIKCIRQSLSLCACGCDWREIDPELLSADELAVSRHVYQLCGFPSKTPKVKSENPLHSLDLRNFVIVLTFIARLFRSMSWATGRPSKSIKLRNGELHGLYCRANSVFENWPHNFHQFLIKQSSGQVRPNPNDGKLDTALKKEFGSLYECLYKDLDGSQFDFLREAFAQFLNDRMRSHSPRSAGDSPSTLMECVNYISLADARRCLKITNTALFDLIAAREIFCAIVNGSRNPEFAIRAGDVETVKWELEQSVTPRELARQLGVNREEIHELASKGLIRPQARRSTDAFNTLRFRRSSAQQFLQKHTGLTHHGEA